MVLSGDRLVVDMAVEDGRYARQELVSWWDQDRLASTRVLVAGAGALGNELVKCLTLLGVGRISLVDFDLVERSNLSRAVFMREDDIGRAKAEVVAERAMSLNPDVNIEPYVGDLRIHFGVGRVAEHDIVLGGLDSRIARLRLNAVAYRAGVPFVDGAIEGLMGVVRVFAPPHSPCYECTMTERDMELVNVRRSCALLNVDEIAAGKVPTTATSASVVAGMQVQEAVKLIHDAPGADALVGRGLMINGSTQENYVVEYMRNELCMAHDTHDVAALKTVPLETTVGELIARAKELYGDGGYVQFEDDVVIATSCPSCGSVSDGPRSAARFSKDDLVCSDCGADLEVEPVSRASALDTVLASATLASIALPDGDVVSLLNADAAADREVLLVGGFNER